MATLIVPQVSHLIGTPSHYREWVNPMTKIVFCHCIILKINYSPFCWGSTGTPSTTPGGTWTPLWEVDRNMSAVPVKPSVLCCVFGQWIKTIWQQFNDSFTVNHWVALTKGKWPNSMIRIFFVSLSRADMTGLASDQETPMNSCLFFFNCSMTGMNITFIPVIVQQYE